MDKETLDSWDMNDAQELDIHNFCEQTQPQPGLRLMASKTFHNSPNKTPAHEISGPSSQSHHYMFSKDYHRSASVEKHKELSSDTRVERGSQIHQQSTSIAKPSRSIYRPKDLSKLSPSQSPDQSRQKPAGRYKLTDFSIKRGSPLMQMASNRFPFLPQPSMKGRRVLQQGDVSPAFRSVDGGGSSGLRRGVLPS